MKRSSRVRKGRRVMKIRTLVGLGAVALASITALTAVASATVPGKNGQIVFRMALGHPAPPGDRQRRRYGRANASSRQGRRRGQSGLVTRRLDDRVPSLPAKMGEIARSFRSVPEGLGSSGSAPPVTIAHIRRGRRTARKSRSRGAGAASRTAGSSSPTSIVMKAGGTGARQITRVTAGKPFSAFVVHPSWSPDGKQLVFSVETTPTGEPANSLRALRRQRRRLGPPPAYALEPQRRRPTRLVARRRTDPLQGPRQKAARQPLHDQS